MPARLRRRRASSRALADYETRTSVEPESKRRVAECAVGLIRSGASGDLGWRHDDAGGGPRVAGGFEATVITHSPTIAAALVPHPSVEILLLGGRIYKHSAVACGAATVEAAAAVSADMFLWA